MREFSSGDASAEELARVFRAACNEAFDGFFASEMNIRRLNEAVARPASSAAPIAASGAR
jgi:hypothetical protein